jgi:hypothetical protein
VTGEADALDLEAMILAYAHGHDVTYVEAYRHFITTVVAELNARCDDLEARAKHRALHVLSDYCAGAGLGLTIAAIAGAPRVLWVSASICILVSVAIDFATNRFLRWRRTS